MKTKIIAGVGVTLASYLITRAMIAVREAPQDSPRQLRDVVALRHCGLKLNEVDDDLIARTPFKTREALRAFFIENADSTSRALYALAAKMQLTLEKAQICFSSKGGRGRVRLPLEWTLHATTNKVLTLSEGKLRPNTPMTEDTQVATACLAPLLVSTFDVKASRNAGPLFDYDGAFPWFVTFGTVSSQAAQSEQATTQILSPQSRATK